jgi:hypothetical protein
MHVFKDVCFRYLSSLGTRLEAIFIHFGPFFAPKWRGNSINTCPKSDPFFRHFLDQYWIHFGTHFGTQNRLKKKAKWDPKRNPLPPAPGVRRLPKQPKCESVAKCPAAGNIFSKRNGGMERIKSL